MYVLAQGPDTAAAAAQAYVCKVGALSLSLSALCLSRSNFGLLLGNELLQRFASVNSWIDEPNHCGYMYTACASLLDKGLSNTAQRQAQRK